MISKAYLHYRPKFHRASLERAAVIAGILGIVGVVTIGSAHAGTQGTEFDSVYTTISGWAQGTLGKIIALAMFITGAAIGVVRQSLLAAVPAIGGALALYAAPTVIGNIMTATLHGSAHILPAAAILGVMS
jgi:conjugal transfer pilus assembly protein TraA